MSTEREIALASLKEQDEARRQELADAAFERQQKAEAADKLARHRAEQDRMERYARELATEREKREVEEGKRQVVTEVVVRDPIERDGAPTWMRLIVESLRDILSRDESERATERADVLTIAARDSWLENAVERMKRIGVVPVGHFSDGRIAVAGAASGLVHIFQSVGRLTARDILFVAGSAALLGGVEPDAALVGDDPAAARCRKERELLVNSLAVLCGLVRLAGEPAAFVDKADCEREERMAELRRQREQATRQAAQNGAESQRQHGEETGADTCDDLAIDPQLIGL
jgi:hypothetical protein